MNTPDPKIKMVPLTALARLEIASLVYGEWSKAFDSLKNVKQLTWATAGKFCPKEDWPLFHKDMLQNAQANFDKWQAIRNEMCHHSPLIAGE